MSYKVTSALVIVPNADKVSGDGYFYKDALVPDGWNDDRCKQLAKEGMLAKVAKTEAAASVPAEPFDPVKGGSVKDTLTYVGDDVDKARAVLELEQAKGDDARKTLVDQLDSIVNPSS